MFFHLIAVYKLLLLLLLGGKMVRASDLQSSGRGFDSQSGRYRAI